MAKLRLISERVNDLPWSPVAEPATTLRAPVMLYMKSLEAQLQGFRDGIPTDLLDNSKPFLI